MWQIGLVLKYSIVLEYYDRTCMRIIILPFTLSVAIQFSAKSADLAQISQFYHKTANNQKWKLSKVKIWPKPNIQNTTYIKSRNLELQRNWVAWYFDTWKKSCNYGESKKNESWTKYLEQSLDPVKLERARKTLVPVIAYFLSATNKFEFLEGRLGTGLRLHQNLKFF